MALITYLQTFTSALVRAHVKNERGASLVEYALLVAMIAIVCIGGATFLGGSLKGRFSQVGSSLQ